MTYPNREIGLPEGLVSVVDPVCERRLSVDDDLSIVSFTVVVVVIHLVDCGGSYLGSSTCCRPIVQLFD